ncbi:MAG: lamin tail domain-containing protein, partial [Clostridia bacterium]|nr:lamin tail domain-containing protein [Clostridia bacterium]
MKRWISILLICCLIGGLFSGCDLFGDSAHVYISEILPENNGVLADETGAHPGWIELYNPTDEAISLEGYTLRSSGAAEAFAFGNVSLDAGDYLVIFASGKNYQDLENRALHTNFTLNASGDTVCLADASGRELSRITYNALSANASCGVDDKGQTVYYLSPTPGTA